MVDNFVLFFSSTITISQGTYAEPFTPCFAGGNLEIQIFIVIAPLLQLTFETIIFILTLVRTAHHVMQSRKSGFCSIAETVLHDGTLYFFTIFIAASIQAAFQLNTLFRSRVISAPEEEVSPFIVSLLSVLPNLLLNRFVLNLRAFSDFHTAQHSSQGPSDTTLLSTLDFSGNRWIGNMGAPLDPNQWDEVDEPKNRIEPEQGDGEIEWEVLDRVTYPLTTQVLPDDI
ncbi:hypothetical protein BDP27DRAFT_1333844 [Rhodocollybia butyracea]|uniref:Uncharacterized protein n=1 Tax=Rhodocollybia butyracea TaxID=206335 RepID=A0A9P5PLM8_9AGAR|nr:hypothetical protein BDP27DRAFT_1333844 [Rhodocollybia butyracea]